MKIAARTSTKCLRAALGDSATALSNIAVRSVLVAATTASAMTLALPAKADEISELRAEIRAMNRRLAEMEDQKAKLDEQKTKIKALNERLQQMEQQQKSVVAAAPASGSLLTKGKGIADDVLSGRPVHIYETSGTDVVLYGIIEATFGHQTNVDALGHTSTGLNVSWFSGNRWGIYGTQKLFSDYGINFIARMESEFELPSGNMDTPGVLFNRDAWVGFEGPSLGKFTVGRQNTLPRDVANIWGDPYGDSKLSTKEGGFTNNNNFKQLIFYTSGGNGAGGQGDTRYDQ